MELQDFGGEKGQHLSSKTVDEQYFVFGNYFGKIVQFSDYKEIEKRDMEKPVRRESLSISPRLAKIMINLSEVKDNEFLLDSFCGIGVILIESLNQEIKVIGCDKDLDAIKGAKENFKHFGFFEEDYKLINEDSSRVNLSEFKGMISGMVSEPDFGEILKKIPTNEKAKEMVERYEVIMANVLNNIKKYVSEKGRIVFTSPYIRVMSKKRIGVDFEAFSEKVGLKMVEGFPIDEFRSGQIVGRQIVVFEN
jgi:tRNA G10  N-methylase Trm11